MFKCKFCPTLLSFFTAELCTDTDSERGVASSSLWLLADAAMTTLTNHQSAVTTTVSVSGVAPAPTPPVGLNSSAVRGDVPPASEPAVAPRIAADQHTASPDHAPGKLFSPRIRWNIPHLRGYSTFKGICGRNGIPSLPHNLASLESR